MSACRPDIVTQLKDPQNVKQLTEIIINLLVLQLRAQSATLQQVDNLRAQCLAEEEELNTLCDEKTPNEIQILRKKELDEKIATSVQLQDIYFLKDLSVKNYGTVLKDLKKNFPGLDASDRRNLEKKLQEQAARKVLAVEELEANTKQRYDIITKLLLLQMKAQPQTKRKLSPLIAQLTTAEREYEGLIQTKSLTPTQNQRKHELEKSINKLVKQRDAIYLKDRSLGLYGQVLNELEQKHVDTASNGVSRRAIEKEMHAHATRQLEIERLSED